MFDLRLPAYQWGQKVRACADLVNDGSYPEVPTDALLVVAGTIGEIVNVGRHEETNMPVYLVEFGDHLVVGCFEEELTAT